MHYDAFISYGHGAGARLPRALQLALERLARPWYKRRALRVFRDDTDLSASPGLWTAIQRGLDQSSYLILLASTDAAQSTWVQREVDHWLRSGRVQRLLLVLCDGEIKWNPAAVDFDWRRTTALPKVLRGAFEEEPLWVDLRWAAVDAELSLANQNFKNDAASIAAPLHGCSKDDLVGGDLLQYRRPWWWVIGVLAVLGLVGVLGGFQWLGKVAERQAKGWQEHGRQVARLAAESLAAQDGDLGLLLAVEAARRQQEMGVPQQLEVDQALRRSLAVRPRLEASLRHQVAVRSMAFAADGESLATADVGGQLRVWQANGRELVRLEHGSPVTALAWSAEGRWLASADEQGTASVWLAATGSERMRFEAADGARIWDLEFSPGAEYLAIASADRSARVFDIASRSEVARLPHPWSVFQVNFVAARSSENPGEWLLTRAASQLRLWRWSRGREQFILSPADPAIQEVVADVDPSGGFLARAIQVTGGQETTLYEMPGGQRWGHFGDDSGGSGQDVEWQLGSSMTAERISWGSRGRLLAVAGRVDGAAVVLDVERLGSGRDPVVTRLRPPEGIRGVEMLPGGRLVTRSDRAVRIWETASGAMLSEIRAAPAIDQMIVASAGERLAVRSGNTVSVWQLQGYQEQLKIADRAPWRDLWSFDGRFLLGQEGTQEITLREAVSGNIAARLAVDSALYAGVKATTFSPDGRWLAAALEQAVVVFDMSSGQAAARIQLAEQPLRVSWSGSGRLALVTRNQLEFWDVVSNQRIFRLPLPAVLGELAASPDGRRLALTFGDHLRLIDTADGRQLAALPWLGQAGLMTWNVASERLATADSAGLRLWDAEGRQVGEFEVVEAGILALEFSPDGELLATGSESGALVLWRVADGVEVQRRQLVGQVARLDFSADGAYLASAAGGLLESRGQAQIWQAEGLRPLADLEHSRGLLAMEFSPDGRWLATRTAEPMLRVWAWRPADLIAEACQRLTRNLSAEEWRYYFAGAVAGATQPYRETCPGLDSEPASHAATAAEARNLSGRSPAGPAIRTLALEQAVLIPEAPLADGQTEPSPAVADPAPAAEPPPVESSPATDPTPKPATPPPAAAADELSVSDIARLGSELKRLSVRIVDEYEDFLDREDYDTEGEEDDIEELLEDFAEAASDFAGTARRASGKGGALSVALRGGKRKSQKRAEDNLRQKRRQMLRYGGRLRPLMLRYPVGSAAERSWRRIDQLLGRLAAESI